MSQLVFSICWNPVEVDSSVSEEMDLLASYEQGDKEQKFPSCMTLYRFSSRSVGTD